jgi:hypothetical protein
MLNSTKKKLIKFGVLGLCMIVSSIAEGIFSKSIDNSLDELLPDEETEELEEEYEEDEEE